MSAALVVAAAPSLAWAQDEAEGDGFYGGGGGPAARQRLLATFTLAGAYDSDVPVEVRSAVDPRGFDSRGYSTLATGSAAYTRDGRVRIGATASSTVRYYGDRREVRHMGHSAGLGMNVQLSRRMSVAVNQTASYSPSYLYRLFPSFGAAGVEGPGVGEAPSTAPDLAVDDWASIVYGSTLRATVRAARGHEVSVAGEHTYTDFRGRSLGPGGSWRDARTYGARARYGFPVSRRVTMSAGYRYRAGDMGYGVAGTETVEHGVDVGMDYVRPLSRTRNAGMSVRVGSAAIDVPASGVSLAGRHYRVTGAMSAGYRFRRTWQASAGYRRDLEYIAELAEPVFSDGVTGAVGGYLARRVNLSIAAAYSKGQSALRRRSLDFDSYTGSSSLRFALTRHVAAYAQYLYYFYDFSRSEGTALPPGMAAGLERYGARMGVTMLVPMIGR